MNRLEFIIDGTPSKSKPENYEKLGVTVDWNQSRGVEVDFDSLIWKGEDAEKIIAMRTDHLGSMVGRPLDIKVVDSDGSMSLPDLMIDLRTKYKQTGCNEVEHSVRFVNQKDWLKSVAAPLQFARLEDEGKFTSSDYIQMPYNLNYIPDAIVTVLLALNTLNLTIQLAKLIRDAGDTTIETTTAIAAVGAAPALTARAIVKALLRVAENAAIIIALVKSIQALSEQIYSRTRYHTCLKVESLFRVASAELGLTFKSTIFQGGNYKDAVIMPSKTERGKFSIAIKNGGAPKSGDSGIYFFGELIETMMSVFNADYRILNNELRFERWDYWQNTSTYVMPNNFTNQSRMLNEFTDNADDFKGGYFISFSLDQKDQNTLDNFNGTAYDVVTQNAVTTGVQYDNDGGSLMIDIPLALGTNKNGLTKLENALISIFKVADSLAALQGLNTGLAASVAGRVGNLQLSDHFTSVPKLLMSSGNSLALNQRTLISAPLIYNEFHFINSFFPISGKHNQWELFEMPVKMCRADFAELLNNNFGKTSDGQDIEVTRLDWNIEEDSANIAFRLNNLYNTNLKQSYITESNTILADNYDI